MRITIKELRRIIKEEVENVTPGTSEDMLDADLASDIKGMVIPESRSRRPLREMDAGMAFGLGAGAAAGLYGLVKWGPSAYRALREKISDWLNERHHDKSVALEKEQIDLMWEELNNDKMLADLLERYNSGEKKISTQITAQISAILRKYSTGLSAQGVRSALRTGVKPSPNQFSMRHERPNSYVSNPARDERNAAIAKTWLK
jgi:hypothetical protein